MYRVEIADATEEFAVLHQAAGAVGMPEGAAAVRELPYGRDLFLPRAELAARAPEFGTPAGMLAYEALRVEVPAAARLRDRPPHHPARGRLAALRRPPPQGLLPRPGDGGPGAQPGQAAAPAGLPAPGRHRGACCPHGTEIRLAADGPQARPLGFVTSSARHYELGPIALALVKRNVPVDATLLAGTVPATQDVVVPQ